MIKVYWLAAAVFLNPSSVGLVMNLQIPRADGKQGPAAMTKNKQAERICIIRKK
jgi:hypothetical protein